MVSVVNTIDSRFNKDNLIARIYAVAERRADIFIYNLDAIDFIKQMEVQSDVILMIDPPYYVKGWSLYNHFYEHHEHEQLARALCDTTLPWLLTYDNTPEISKMYAEFAQHPFSINYSVGHRGVGKELLITSNHFDIVTLSC